MTHQTARRFTLAALLALGGCAGQVSEGNGGDEGSSDEVTATDFTADAANVGGKARVVAQSGLNLRSGPSTSNAILLTMPNGSVVSVLATSAGWYKVDYSGRVGWSSGAYLTPIADGGGGGGGGGGGNGTVEQIMSRARSVVGYSYHWGGGCWDPNGGAHGACYGSCPNCSHSGQWGADCSGFVAKAWQVPGPSALTSCAHPYSTYHFTNQRDHWYPVARGTARRADAFTYNSGGAGHIFLYEGGDAWGWMKAYECKGCSYGCVYNSRTAGNNYSVIRREGL